MSASDRGSGEIDPPSELSLWYGAGWDPGVRRGLMELSPVVGGSSTASLNPLVELREFGGAFRRVCGFIDGDCCTTRAGGFRVVVDIFRLGFRGGAWLGFDGTVVVCTSMFMSGDAAAAAPS
jgi:hypothetical protein